MKCVRAVVLAGLLLSTPAWARAADVLTQVHLVLPRRAGEVVRRIAELFQRQVQQRCQAKVLVTGESPPKVELAIEPGIGAEGFAIAGGPAGGVRIVGNDERGLLYGVGKFLRSSRYDQGGFTPGAWRGRSVPEKPVRGIYFATHFHNFYHDAPIGEVQRYVEDLGLWGFNTLIVWYDMHHFNGFDSPEAVEFRNRLEAICGSARRLGLDVGLVNIANEGYGNSPKAIRADVKGMRGAAFPTDICTARPEGRQYVLDNFARQYAWARDLGPKWVVIWPYDSGGCGCAQCQPWGDGGYLRMAEPVARLAQREFPGVKVVLSAWLFNGVEWAGLRRAFATRPDWVDFLLVEPRYMGGATDLPPAHPSPGGIPLVGFPEVTMAGSAWAWGGIGANPLPTRYEREWKEVKAPWQGGFPYSEGIWDDLNKALFASFYWKADATADEALKEYIAFEYSPEVVDLVLPAIRLVEKNVTPQKRAGSWSLKARDLMERADARLTAESRQAWRWRILLLRARIDAQLCLTGGTLRGRVLHDACQELTGIYHAEHAEPYVKPPQVDPTEPPATGRLAQFQGPPLAEGYGRAVLSSKPMAYWRMDDLAGDMLKDATGNGHSAACEGDVDLSPPVDSRPANPAAVLWGGRISAAMDRLPDTFSVELWVWNELPSTRSVITAYLFSRGMAASPGTAGGDNLGIGGTYRTEAQGKLFFFNDTKSNQFLSGRTTLKPGKWHHVVVVRRGRGISAYLDGGPNPEIGGQAEIGYPTGCGQLFFGARNDGFAPLQGKLDEVSVYNRALGPDEIAAHYAAAQAPK